MDRRSQGDDDEAGQGQKKGQEPNQGRHASAVIESVPTGQNQAREGLFIVAESGNGQQCQPQRPQDQGLAVA